MKKITFLVFFTVLHTTISYSQLTYVPDDNFEQYLIDQGYDFGIPNDFVPTVNISGITILNIDDKGISDLTGIEDFTALTELRCYTNSITTLDVSANTQLNYLHCSANSLTSLDVSANTQLQFLNCSINSIGSLNLNQNSLLSNFDASNNLLTAVSIKNGAGNIITNFNTINNPNLTCIQVDNATYSTNNWTDIDATSSFSEDCHYNDTYIPDDNFEQALIDLGYDSGSLDDYVPTANIDTVTSLTVDSEGISDLTGIEDFAALTSLSCINNNLINLDFSNNPNLDTLFCATNNLTSIDVSINTSLSKIFCSSNDLTSIDISNNPLLEDLDFRDNDLTTIDLSNNPLLDYLNSRDNNLISLNLTNNPLLEYLHTSDNDLIGINLKNGNNTIITTFNTTNNPNLTCIQVEDATYSTNNWTFIDAQTSFSEDCHYGETYVPDDNFEQALINLGYDSGPLDDYVPTANINTVTSLDVGAKNISDLTGIENFSALLTLICISNNLTSLDISNNTALTELLCQYNSNLNNLDVSNNTALTLLSCRFTNLNNLDVSNNTALTGLYCQSNNLTSLNLSNNSLLENLYCNDNELTGINLKNGNNTMITGFDTINNPNLTCIDVDDVTYSTTNWTDIDAQTGFATNCSNTTYVPDDNFEQALIDLGHDFGPLDNYVFTSNINTLTSLDVGAKNISDLTGIEDFAALLTLICISNNLTSLDISNNTALTELLCQYNSNLNNLDVSNNTALTLLSCRFTNLNNLDVSNNTALTGLYCQSNNLTSLNLSNNSLLENLYCNDNELTGINLKNGNNTIITGFDTINNPNLTCIDVDDVTYSTTNWTGIDVQTGFSEDCSGVLSLEELTKNTFKVYPNPTSTVINIDSQTTIVKVEIFDLIGKQILTTNETTRIDVEHIPSGMYLLKVYSEKGFATKQIIIQ